MEVARGVIATIPVALYNSTNVMPVSIDFDESSSSGVPDNGQTMGDGKGAFGGSTDEGDGQPGTIIARGRKLLLCS
jgi:hypothetical protein